MEVDAVQFGLINPDEIRRFSVTQKAVINGKRVEAGIHQTTLKDHSGEPILGGLLDPRLGDPRTTPGYFGHCELARPVYHINFIDTVISVLQCVSFTDSQLLMTDEELELLFSGLTGKERLPAIASICKHRKQDILGNAQPKFKKDKNLRVTFELNDNVQELRAVDAMMILERISDEDCLKLGLNPKYARPEWMIFSVLPIPPLSVRPSVAVTDSDKCEDDLTHKLVAIVKTNNELQTRIKKGLAQEKIDEMVAALQYHIGTYIDNSSTLLVQDKHRTGRPLRTLTQRLKGKEGRVRGNLMGKRVDFTARTVITADPNLSLDQVGVPLEIAMTLTVPERVTSFNIHVLQKLVDNGPDYFPGANYVTKNGWRLKSGIIQDVKVDLRFVKRLKLREGWTVHRHMKNNDVVMFNRQPSLHKMSLMGHRVRVLKGATFRMNLSATTPYNADFDGDEMNLHCPQDLGSRAEIEELMMVDKLIVSPQSNKPVMGIIQDSLLAAALLTQRNVLLTCEEMFNAIMFFSESVNIPEPAVICRNSEGKLIPYYTGKQLFSLIIPDHVYLQRKSNYFNNDSGNDKYMDDGFVHIIDGEIVSGVMDKKSLGTSEGGLIHMIFNDIGHDAARNFINTVQKVCNYWISNHSFSIGFGDTIADETTNQRVREILDNGMNEAYELIKKRENGEIEIMKGMNLTETFEQNAVSILNRARDEAGKIAEKSLTNNGFKTTAISGSKGSTINITQICSCVGQQNLNGKRVQYGFENRTLPHFQTYDDGPEARGFVKNCYLKGLNPSEFFFHAMSGRIGVIDTAIKSLIFDTQIVIVENGFTKFLEIGPWIDEKMKDCENDIQRFPDNLDMEYLDLNEDVYVPTVDDVGNVSWKQVTAVTRHDHEDKLFEVETKSGRKVVVPDTKSLLIWNGEIFEQTLTTKAKIGDCMPTNIFCGEPPIIHEYIELSNYLSKKQFVFGSDFHKAIELKKNGANRWWKNNNGNTFILPFVNSSRFSNTVKNTKTKIQKNYVYTYYGPRNDCQIPERFELNWENGFFLGLYLADGDIETNTIRISKNDKIIQQFVTDWFTKFKINSEVCIRFVDDGESSCVRGFSSVMAHFIRNMCNTGSENKRVPDEAFSAPDSFVKGLLSGYFTGDGCVTEKGGITSGSTSKDLSTGISFLCNRFGIFTKLSITQQKKNNKGTNPENILPSHKISIHAKYAKRFAEIVTLLIESKQTRLDEISMFKDNEHQYYKTPQNDVMLDPIIRIEKIKNPENYKKVYDLTVPETLNFGLANGLQVADTSTTGYTQRKIIKSVEDLQVKNDGTVRNAQGMIMQFLYGEDGMDGAKVETEIIDIDSELGTHELENQQLIEDKEMLKQLKIPERTVLPVPLRRIILQARKRFKGELLNDVDYIFESVKGLIDRLEIIAENPEMNYNGKLFLSIHIRTQLSSKKVMETYKMSKKAFDYVIGSVESRFRRAKAVTGEMVGVLCAQSLGKCLPKKVYFQRIC